MKTCQHILSVVALAALILASSCSRDSEVYQPSKAEIMANAKERLGVAIDPSLDWNMTLQGRASITVNGNDDETYTVKIYSNDPLADKHGYVLRKGEVKGGETFITEFDYPSANEWIVVGLTDKQGYTSYRSVQMDNGLLVTTIDGMTETAQNHTAINQGVVTEEAAVWTYAFEDTPLGDYDMNDVVIKVREIQTPDAPDQLEVTLCCVGASFDLRVYLGGQKIFGGLEVHRVMGQPSGTFINTGAGPEVVIPQTSLIDKPVNFSFATADFWIDSPAVKGGVHVAKTGDDPHGVVIPGDWKWPREAVSIKDVYPNFARFATDIEKADDEARMWYVTTDTTSSQKMFIPSNLLYQPFVAKEPPSGSRDHHRESQSQAETVGSGLHAVDEVHAEE